MSKKIPLQKTLGQKITKEKKLITYVSGDILLSKAQAVVHGIAPHDDFKQGLALQLREQWPSMYKDFRHYCKTTNPKPGELWAWRAAGSPLIVNLMTQNAPRTKEDHPGKAEIKHLNSSLKELKKVIEEEGVQSLAITRLATGVGGLEWNEVKPLLEEHFLGFSQQIEIYEVFQKGQEPKAL